MKVLVVGCNGQVGSCLVEQLRSKIESIESLSLSYEELDITQQQAVYDRVCTFKPDFILNAAAYTEVDRAEDEIETANAINRDGAKYLAQAAQQCGSVMVHISTDYVFDGKGIRAYKESDKTAPQCVYGKSKLSGEYEVAKACSKHIILRTAWVFGERGKNFVKTMLHLAKSRDELGVVDDQFGGPTYAHDIASAMIEIVEIINSGHEPEWGIYHFSGYPHVSWYQFAESIFAVAERKGVIAKKMQITSVPTSAYPTRAKRPANSRMNCDKIERAFGIKQSDWLGALNDMQLSGYEV